MCKRKPRYELTESDREKQMYHNGWIERLRKINDQRFRDLKRELSDNELERIYGDKR